MQIGQAITGQKRTAGTAIDVLRDHAYGVMGNKKIRNIPSKWVLGLNVPLIPKEFNFQYYISNRPFIGKKISAASASYLLSMARIGSCKEPKCTFERLPVAFDRNMSSKPMFNSGIIIWDEGGEINIWKRIGESWCGKEVSSDKYEVDSLKVIDNKSIISWLTHNSIVLWLEKNGSWKSVPFALNQEGPFETQCNVEILGDDHFLSWDDDFIFIWTKKGDQWVPERVDIFPDTESFDDESDGESEISDSSSVTSYQEESSNYSIGGLCKVDSRIVAYWVERHLMILKQDDGGDWKSNRLSEFNNSINKLLLHPEGYLVVLSKDDNGNSTISSVNIIEQSGELQVSVIARISGLWDMDLLPDGRVVTADKRGEFTVWWEGDSKETWFSKRIGELEESKPWFKIQKDGSILSWTEKGGIKHWFECSTDWIINFIGPALDSENIEIIDDYYISARVESPEHGREADDLVFYHLHPSGVKK